MNTRKWTRALLDAIDGGIISPTAVASACLGYMSEDDVEDMCRANDLMCLFEVEDDDEDDDEDDEPNGVSL